MNRLALVLWLLALASSVHAATTCRVTRSGTLSFGSYDVMSPTPSDSLLNVDVACDRRGGPQRVTVMMRLGLGNGPAVNARRLVHTGGTGEYLQYGLFRDIARSSVWGYSDGVDTVARELAVPNNSSATATFVIYGRIQPQQDVPVGIYTDSVQISITP